MSIRLEIQDQVARILISHPARMNALGETQIRQLEQISRELAAQQGLRVILLKAEGEVFGAGGDMRGLAQEAAQTPPGEVTLSFCATGGSFTGFTMKMTMAVTQSAPGSQME